MACLRFVSLGVSRPLWALWLSLICLVGSIGQAAEPIQFHLRHRTETAPKTGRYHTLIRDEAWDPAKTAVIVCDVWDYHHCYNAVQRLTEFGPRLNELVANARERGMTIIHSPSDCMPSYEGHPARQRAIDTPKAAKLPADIQSWCSKIPSEEAAIYPIDQSDGGEDDEKEQHAKWARVQPRRPPRRLGRDRPNGQGLGRDRRLRVGLLRTRPYRRRPFAGRQPRRPPRRLGRP